MAVAGHKWPGRPYERIDKWNRLGQVDGYLLAPKRKLAAAFIFASGRRAANKLKSSWTASRQAVDNFPKFRSH